jgi:hypothetical protein
MPEYLHALAGAKPVADFEFHGVIDQIMPSFLHGDAAISMWWWNDQKHWTPNEPINEWASSFPQSYTIPLSDVAKAMRDSLDLRRLSTEISALAQAPRPVALLYSKASMLQQPPRSSESDSTPYLFYLRQIYNASQAANAYVGITTEKKILAGDLNNRKVLIITATEFMPAEVARRILDWVSSGGMLLLSPDSMLSDEYGRQLTTAAQLGFRLLRREPPRLRRGERDITPYNFSDLPHMSLTPTAGSIASSLSLDAVGARQVIACDSGIVAARFADHNPALLDIKRGKGHIYWLAAPLDPRSWRRLLAAVSEQAGASLPMRVRAADGRELADLEYRVVQNGTSHLAYFYNNTDEAIHFRVTPRFSFSHVIDRRTESRVAGTDYVLPARETAIVEFTGNP